MGRIWQWLWNRFGPTYSWVICGIACLVVFPIYAVPSVAVVAWERSTGYVSAIVATAVGSVVVCLIFLPPGHRRLRSAQRWAAGEDVDNAAALSDTYVYARRAVARGIAGQTVGVALLLVVVAAMAGTPWLRLLQYAVLGASAGLSVTVIGAHNFVEAALRPTRTSLIGNTVVGDALARSRPSFATWSNLAMVAAAFGFTIYGAVVASVNDVIARNPALCVAFGAAVTLFFATPLTVGTGFGPSLQPIRDLAKGTERVAAGDYSQLVPVVQDDDLGALAASFNRMQSGLLERQRLRSAFSTYVDPTLATRLLQQGDDVFTGERCEVTVMFVDIRDFTPFAESNTAEDTVTRLNRLFEIVVPAVVDAGGHVNKFLGDGALAVFGAPNAFPGHADAATTAAVRIQTVVTEKFGTDLRVGIGINTGVVIAGTIGGGGKLEFTLIGDTVNVAARVEQLTKTTGDGILFTGQTVDAMAQRPPGLIERGPFPLKGKSAAVSVYGLAVPGGGNLGQANYARG